MSLTWLGPVTRLDECVGIVGEDYGEVVRGARPLTTEDAAQMREQEIARLKADPVAVAARERRMAVEQAPKVLRWRAR